MDSVVDGVVAIACFPDICIISESAFEVVASFSTVEDVVAVASVELVIPLSSVEDVAAVISIELVVSLAAELDVVHRISALQGVIAVCSSADLRQLVHFVIFEHGPVVKDDLVYAVFLVHIPAFQLEGFTCLLLDCLQVVSLYTPADVFRSYILDF